MECDVSVRMTRQPKQRAVVLRPPACCACACTSCHCCLHCPTLVLMKWLSFSVAVLFVNCCIKRCSLSSFLEAMQNRQRFLEVKSMPYRHRIGIHLIRTVTVVFACKSVHFKNDLFRMTQLDHGEIDRECFRIVSFDTFFEVVLPCRILCNLLSSRTCDCVAGPS